MTAQHIPHIIRSGLLLGGLLLAALLSGCATATSSLECGLESMNPTVMATVDSFESAALAIKLSNRVLLEMPINEQDSWPDKLYGAPSGAGMLMMGLSLLGSSQGITVPFEIDPSTGLPRPTSALYLFLKEREKLLTKEVSRDDLSFFRSQPPQVIARQIPLHRRQANVQLIDEHVYRNPLMAFGVVTANQDEMVRVQQDVELLAKGFKQCDAWVHASREGDVKSAACQDPALKQGALEARIKKTAYTPAHPLPEPQPPDEQPVEEPLIKPPRDLRDAVGGNGSVKAARSNPGRGQSKTRPLKNSRSKRNQPARLTEAAPDAPPTQTVPSQGIIYVSEQDRQVGEKTEELETMRKNYGKLAGRVYNASVAGADFTTAAIIKIGCAIVNGARALPNINNEFKGARGVYNLTMVVSRVKMIISAFGFYQKNLGLQFTAYTTMSQQIKGTYPDLKDDDPVREQKTAQTLQRIAQANALLRQLEPKLLLLAQDQDVRFSDEELAQLATLSKLYPDQRQIEQEFLLAWQNLTDR
ncbi:MAG: hypothetical protein WBI04_07865 [Trichlorobacter sp.]